MLAFVTLMLVITPTAPASAAPEDGCGPSWISWTCTGAKEVVHGAKKIPGVGSLINAAESATKAVDALNPQNFLDSWAQGLCHAVIFALTFIETTAEKLGTPAFDQRWWADQYAVSFGLALVLLAFLLAVITARVGGPEGSVSGVELLRQSGWRLIFVVPVCALGPAILYSLQQAAAALTKSFSTQATVQANGAVGGLLKKIQDTVGKGAWSDMGGTVMVIVLLVPILCCGVVLLVEVAIGNWGLMLCGLLVPLALVSAVYPPWARILRRLCGIILGLMFLPAVIFFFFWTVWSAFNSNINGQGDGSNSTVTMLVYLLVSLIMIDVFPIIAVWLLGIVAPGAEQMDPQVRAAAPQPTPGDVYSGSFEKLEPNSWNGGGEGGEGSGGGEAGTGGSDESSEDSGGVGESGVDNSGPDDHGGGDPGGGNPGGGNSSGDAPGADRDDEWANPPDYSTAAGEPHQDPWAGPGPSVDYGGPEASGYGGHGGAGPWPGSTFSGAAGGWNESPGSGGAPDSGGVPGNGGSGDGGPGGGGAGGEAAGGDAAAAAAV